MCLTIVGKVISVEGKRGVVEISGARKEMNLSLVDVKQGDFVSCALGLAVEKLDNAEALAIIEARRPYLETGR